MSDKKNSTSPSFPLPGSVKADPDLSIESLDPSVQIAQSDVATTEKNDTSGRNEAKSIIRKKISALYKDEPNVDAELEEALEPGKHSIHQEFLLNLHNSGKSAEQIQVDWHSYYEQLDNDAKFDVWQEFYTNQNNHSNTVASPHTAKTVDVSEKPRPRSKNKKPKIPSISISGEDLRARIKRNAKQTNSTTKSANTYKKKVGLKHHLQSVAFGLVAGFVFLSIYMFTFFNERFIIPFVQPSTISASTQIITVPNATVSSEPRVIIPKLNVEAPVVYDVPFIQPGETEDDFEKRTQEALETGVVHYPTSQLPGEAGAGFNSNVVIVGHSSNNLFSRGNFKFAFMQIGQLEIGDTFMINKDSKQYVYKVYEKKVVPPTEVSVLGAASRPNSATLITCDPPGFNTNRMIVIAEQISPDPATNVATTAPALAPADSEVAVVPGNPQSLWSKVVEFIF